MFTVTTAATVTALTTLAAVKTELDITGTDENDWLLAQIAVATDQICSYLNVPVAGDGTKTLGRETIVETIRFPHNTVWGPQRNFVERKDIILSRHPVLSVSSVVEDGTALTTDEYELDGAQGTLSRLTTDDFKRTWFANKVVVTYVAGWLLPGETGRTLPYDIEDACIQLVKAERFARKRDPMLKGEETAGIGRNDYWVGATPGGNSIPSDIAAALDPYRNISV